MTTVILAGVVSAVRGLTSCAIQSYKKDDREEPLLPGSRDKDISNDFSSFQFTQDIDFDFTDKIFEEFSIPKERCEEITIFDDSEDLNEYCFLWKEYRPSLWSWLLVCLKVSLWLSLACIVIGLIVCGIVFIDFNTAAICHDVDVYEIKKPVQQIKVLGQTIEGHMCNYFHLIILSFTFGLKFMHKLRLLYISMYAALADSFYRIVIYLFGFYNQSWIIFPLNVLIVSVILKNSYKVANYFHRENRLLKSRLIFQLGLQYCIALLIIFSTIYLLIPHFISLNKEDRLLVACASPILGAVAKTIARLSAQYLGQITHPGNLFSLVIMPYIASTILYRSFQASIQDSSKFVFLCFLHGFTGLLERASILLRDHFYRWFYKKVLKRQTFKSRIGLFKTPKTQRLLADIAICHMIQERVVLLYCNALIGLYPFIYVQKHGNTGDDLRAFFIRCGLATGIEFIFDVLSICFLTYILNIPIVKLWKRHWRRYCSGNLIPFVIMSCYATQYLIILARVDPNRKTFSSLGFQNNSGAVCNVSELLFYSKLVVT